MQASYYGSTLNCGCRGSCNCYLPPIPHNKPRHQVRPDISILVDILTNTLSCGNNDLTEHLKKFAPIVIRRNAFCHNELFFISAQIEMIDLSLQFIHSTAVDYSDSRSTSKSSQTSRSKSTTEAKAQATSYSNSCSFSNAESFNQFVRDSYDRARSQSITNSESNGRSDSHTWDRSQQEAQELSQVWDTSRSESDGEGRGSHSEITGSSGASYSRTAPEPSIFVNDIDAGNAALSNAGFIIADIWKGITDATVAGFYAWKPLGSDNFDFNYDDFGKPILPGFTVLDDIFSDTIDSTYRDPGVQVPVIGVSTPDQYCCCDGLLLGPLEPDCQTLVPGGRNCHWKNEKILPTEGEMYSVKWSITIGFTFIKKGISLTISWGRSGNWNRSHIITKACTKSVGESETENFYDQTDWSRAHGETLTRQHSYTQRDHHVRADSERTAHSRTDAGSANTGDAEGKSESGAEREAHSETRGSSQATNWSESRSRANSLTVSDSESNSIAENLSDVFKALSKMRDILFDQQRMIRNRFNAMRGASVDRMEKCCYAIPADPVEQAMLRSLHTRWHNLTMQSSNRQPISASQVDTNCTIA